MSTAVQTAGQTALPGFTDAPSALGASMRMELVELEAHKNADRTQAFRTRAQA